LGRGTPEEIVNLISVKTDVLQQVGIHALETGAVAVLLLGIQDPADHTKGKAGQPTALGGAWPRRRSTGSDIGARHDQGSFGNARSLDPTIYRAIRRNMHSGKYESRLSFAGNQMGH
jgi:hypothetical protein